MSIEENGDDAFQFDLFGPGEGDSNVENKIVEAEVAKVNSKVIKLFWQIIKLPNRLFIQIS